MKTPTETSPYKLMQEEFRDQPWKLLVACICLNQCSAKVARPVWEKIFQVWPSLTSLLTTERASARVELVDLLRPLGFQNRRADRILRMSEDLFERYDDGQDRMMIDPLSLYGCGKYAADSYNMFVKGNLVEDVQDKELRNYLSWAKNGRSTQATDPERTDPGSTRSSEENRP